MRLAKITITEINMFLDGRAPDDIAAMLGAIQPDVLADAVDNLTTDEGEGMTLADVLSSRRNSHSVGSDPTLLAGRLAAWLSQVDPATPVVVKPPVYGRPMPFDPWRVGEIIDMNPDENPSVILCAEFCEGNMTAGRLAEALARAPMGHPGHGGPTAGDRLRLAQHRVGQGGGRQGRPRERGRLRQLPVLRPTCSARFLRPASPS